MMSPSADKRAVARAVLDAVVAERSRATLRPQMTNRPGAATLTRWTFTSESVTEGHPDKMADQISDSILDAILDQDPMARVACETMVTTGLAIVAGEITTTAYVEIPKIVRETINGIGYDRESVGFDGNTCGVITSIDPQSPDIAQGVDTAFETRTGVVRRGRPQQPGRRRPGDDVRLRLRRDRRPHAAADLAGPPAGRAPGRGPQGRASLPYLRPDGKTQVTVDYEDNKPGRAQDRAHLHPAPARASTPRRTIKPDLIEHVIRPSLPEQFADDDFRVLRQPDRQVRARRPPRRLRPHRPQDHRRHLRRHGPPRRRRLLGQGPVQGRPLGRLRRPLGGQERRRRRRGRPAARSRWPTPSASPSRSRCWSRRSAPRRSTRRRSSRPCATCSTCARRPSSATSTCAGRSTRRPRPTATSAAPTRTSPGSTPAGSAT